MDTSVAVAIISLLGGASVALLGFILTGVRAELRSTAKRLGTLERAFVRLEERVGGLEERVGSLERAFVRLEERVGGLEERVGGLEERVGGLERAFSRFEERSISEFGQIKDVLARIEAAQTEQSRQAAQIATDHGERIAALERAAS